MELMLPCGHHFLDGGYFSHESDFVFPFEKMKVLPLEMVETVTSSAPSS